MNNKLSKITRAAFAAEAFALALPAGNNATGLVTPPVGTVLNVASGVAWIPMHDVTRGVMPFMLSQLAVLFLMVLFPQLVMVPLALFH